MALIQAQRAGPDPGELHMAATRVFWDPHRSQNVLSPAGLWAWHRRCCLISILGASSGDALCPTGNWCLSPEDPGGVQGGSSHSGQQTSRAEGKQGGGAHGSLVRASRCGGYSQADRVAV